MHSFTDNEGREWQVNLNLKIEGDVYRAAGVYLSDLSDNATLGRLENDRGLLATVLWALVNGQHEGVSEDDFLAAIGGPSLEAAYDSVLEETLDFLGRPGEAIRKSRKERKRIEDELEAQNLEGLQEMTGEQAYGVLTSLPIQTLKEALAGFTDLAGSVEESAESTPETSASAS